MFYVLFNQYKEAYPNESIERIIDVVNNDLKEYYNEDN